MPTFKHPCPYCGKLIDKISAACPYCGVVEPFSPKRCQVCRKIVEDPAWVVCPSCGSSLIAPVITAAGATPTGTATGTVPGGAGQAGQAAPPAAALPAASPAASPAQPQAPVQAAPPASGGKCSGCGAPLPSGARFCTVCGTVAG